MQDFGCGPSTTPLLPQAWVISTRSSEMASSSTSSSLRPSRFFSASRARMSCPRSRRARPIALPERWASRSRRVNIVGVRFVVGKGGVEAACGDVGLFEDSLPAHFLVSGDDLPHVERRAWYPRAAAALRPAERYAGVPLRPGRFFGGPPETLVLGDVQDDAYTFIALVRERALRPRAVTTSTRQP